jgi:hypothetical protein
MAVGPETAAVAPFPDTLNVCNGVCAVTGAALSGARKFHRPEKLRSVGRYSGDAFELAAAFVGIS